MGTNGNSGSGMQGGGADAGVIDDPGDMGAADCFLPDSLGNLGALAGARATQKNQQGSMGARKVYDLIADLSADPDVLDVQLLDERGVFAGPVAPGTYEITGAETNSKTCGACVYVLADIVPMVGAKKFYLAQSGTLVVDSITPELSGSLSNVTVQEIDLNTGAPVTGGCTATIEAATFSAPLTIQDP